MREREISLRYPIESLQVADRRDTNEGTKAIDIRHTISFVFL